MAPPTTRGNTVPIYPASVLHVNTFLKTEVVPRIPTVQTPVEVLSAGSFGAIIYGVEMQPLGNNTATVLRLFTQRVGTTGFKLEAELVLPATTTASETAVLAPVALTLPSILPTGNRALHLEAGEVLYASLSIAVEVGFNLIVRGGNY